MLIALPLILLAYAGCLKTNDSASKSNMDYLTASAWYLKAFRYDIAINGTVDYSYPPDNCEADDKYSFSADNSLLFDPGAKLCHLEESVVSRAWTISPADTKLSFGGSTYTIKTLNDSLMTLSYDTTETGTRYRAYIDFQHK